MAEKDLENSFVSICFAGIFFAGCASLDRIPMTTFEPLDGPNKERQFRFTAKSDIVYPANTPDGERIPVRSRSIHGA